MAPTLEEFRRLLRTTAVDEITETVILGSGAAHVSPANEEYLKQELQRVFALDSADVHVVIVGSAKLGYSLIEKDQPSFKPRYRNFSNESDIDVAVVCPKLYSAIWRELSVHSHSQAYFPWNAGKLSDYMLVGWLRPDKTPRSASIRHIDEWWRLFGTLSNLTRFERRRVRGGLYYATSFLHSYHRRAVAECAALESP